MNCLWKRLSRFQWNGDKKLSNNGHVLFVSGYPDPIHVPGASLIPLAIGSNLNDSKDKNCTSLVEGDLARGALATLGSDGIRDVRIEHSGGIVLRHLNPHVQQQSSLHLVSIPQWNMAANTTTAIFTPPVDSSDLSIVLSEIWTKAIDVHRRWRKDSLSWLLWTLRLCANRYIRRTIL